MVISEFLALHLEMKQILIILAIFSFLTSFGQSRELTLEIQSFESVNSTFLDSIEIELTNQGFANMGEQLTIPTKKVNDKTSLLKTINIQSDSTTLKIYFNKQGFVEIINLDYLRNDTLIISSFPVYPDCIQKGKWFTKTVFDNDNEGETDFLNYKTESKLEFDLKDEKCEVPNSIALTINGLNYQEEVQKKPQDNSVTTGHGRINRFWIGKKKYFHFKRVELDLIRKVKIEIKKIGY